MRGAVRCPQAKPPVGCLLQALGPEQVRARTTHRCCPMPHLARQACRMRPGTRLAQAQHPCQTGMWALGPPATPGGECTRVQGVSLEVGRGSISSEVGFWGAGRQCPCVCRPAPHLLVHFDNVHQVQQGIALLDGGPGLCARGAWWQVRRESWHQGASAREVVGWGERGRTAVMPRVQSPVTPPLSAPLTLSSPYKARSRSASTAAFLAATSGHRRRAASGGTPPASTT